MKVADVRQRMTRSTDSMWATAVRGRVHGFMTSVVTQGPATRRSPRLYDWTAIILNF